MLVDDQGRVVAVGTANQLPAPERARSLSFPAHALLPGFVNGHTHLELHGLRDMVPEEDFLGWLQHVRELKASRTTEDFRAAAQAGVQEGWRFGATTFVDTGTSGATVHALSLLGARGTYYHEVIAPEPNRSDGALAEARATLSGLAAHASSTVRLGLSPHAPYTVSPALMTATAALAREAGVPLAAHIAESPAEAAFLARGAGPFADLWRRRDIPLPAPAASPVCYCHDRGLLGPDLLAIHVVQANDDDVALLVQHGVGIAACPRSNRRHGHGDAPLAPMLRAGLKVALGTDSAASVDSLDLLAEARVARQLAACSAERALRLLTIEGAIAVGWGDEVGSLEPRKWADGCVLALPELSADPERLAETVLEAGSGAIAATIIGGRTVWSPERLNV